MYSANDVQKKGVAEAHRRLDTQEKQTERLYQLMGIVILVLFVAFVSIGFAYIQFVITESNNRISTENNLVSKISDQNYKIDNLLQNLPAQQKK